MHRASGAWRGHIERLGPDSDMPHVQGHSAMLWWGCIAQAGRMREKLAGIGGRPLQGPGSLQKRKRRMYLISALQPVEAAAVCACCGFHADLTWTGIVQLADVPRRSFSGGCEAARKRRERVRAQILKSANLFTER